MQPPNIVGYAAVGLGWIAQAAMLPAFANASRNSRLVSLVSGDERKRQALARRYDLDPADTFDYDDYDACLERDDVHAVYIAVPNHLHREYAVRAAERGVHVLCEKPMAVTVADCRAMIDACRANDVRLMIAYRLHFDPANLRAVELVKQGRFGETRILDATFTQQVHEGDVRLVPSDRGGGPLYDIGIYCINAARYLFRAEPERVRATVVRRDQPRFAEVEEAASCVLRFPGERLAAFTCSFGASPVSVFHLVGDDGEMRMTSNAFNFSGDRRLIVRDGDDEEEQAFPEAHQFGPQLLHFSDCVLQGRDPGPDGEEGLVDVAIVRALYESLETGREVELDIHRDRRPEPDQAIALPPVETPELIGAEEPSK